MNGTIALCVSNIFIYYAAKFHFNILFHQPNGSTNQQIGNCSVTRFPQLKNAIEVTMC